MTRFVSWNVNGLRACLKKGFLDFVTAVDADVLCLQETKLQEQQVNFDLPGYHRYWNCADKAGYSGTAIFSKTEPLSVVNDFGKDIFRHEGRVITAEYPEFYVVCCYTPNSQRDLARLEYRMDWDDAFRVYLQSLSRKKSVICCGDFNVAHEEIDLRHPDSNHLNAGFTDEERLRMSALLRSGFLDTFRTLHPDTQDAYTWWSYRAGSRERNVGWRIDYILTSLRLRFCIQTASILSNVMGSDHCPVLLELQ